MASRPFAPAEIDLIDELAGRLGAALNSAVLFDRQTRSSAALDTLQQVSGRIAAVATTTGSLQEVLTYGSAGIRADGGVVFLVDDDGELTFKAGHRRRATARDATASWVLHSKPSTLVRSWLPTLLSAVRWAQRSACPCES